ncbi:pilus biosynthesis protein [Bifidobacterium pseudolongum subsp. globosum]|nr:pilus biosynthesis protein [Bifidobacterium pseudolongum subsp. globosum]RYQ78155.1 pilus biosynthesis protein [Bifidobacterium pseudolongum subsp. globosum]
MNWLAWWAVLCVGAAVWLCMRAPHARLRDAHEAPGASAEHILVRAIGE